MKKTDTAVKAVGAVFLIAIIAYIAFYIVSSLSNPFQMAKAVDYTVRDTIDVTGIVVRDETVLQTGYDSVYVSAEEGKKVSSGGTVALVYSSDEGLENAEKMREIESQISGLQKLESGSLEDNTQKVETDIKSDIQSMRLSVQNHNLTGVDNMAIDISNLAFTVYSDATNINTELESLNSEYKSLQSSASEAYDTITAPDSGLFSRTVDGFEDVKPENIQNVDVTQLNELMQSERQIPDNAIGKLVYGVRWYYAVVMSDENAEKFRVGDTATMIFGRYYSENLEMSVDDISESEDGQHVVVFSCATAMSDVLSMRMQSSEIILGEYSGIRIPKKALRVDDDGNSYVYVQTGMQAEKKIVTVKYDIGDYYVVESSTLREGDTIIVRGKDLYEGKVVG